MTEKEAESEPEEAICRFRPGTTLIESIMVLTSDRSASGVLNSRHVDSVRSTSSLANSSILVWYRTKKSPDFKKRAVRYQANVQNLTIK